MYTYDDISTTILILIGALGAFILFTNALKAWRELRQPNDELKVKVDEHDKAIKADGEKFEDHEKRIEYLEGCCAEVHGKLDNDFSFQQEEKEFNKLMLEAIAQLLKHSIDGNDRTGLKEMESRIDRYLLDQM